MNNRPMSQDNKNYIFLFFYFLTVVKQVLKRSFDSYGFLTRSIDHDGLVQKQGQIPSSMCASVAD